MGHGTHIAGIVGAEMNNTVGIAGVASGCKLLIMQALSWDNAGTTASFKNALIAAVDSGVRIINASLGFGPISDVLIEDAIRYADSLGVLIVASTGNNAGAVHAPARYSATFSNVIAVGSTNRSDIKVYTSNYGPEVNVVAPGGGALNHHLVRIVRHNHRYLQRRISIPPCQTIQLYSGRITAGSSGHQWLLPMFQELPLSSSAPILISLPLNYELFFNRLRMTKARLGSITITATAG